MLVDKVESDEAVTKATISKRQAFRTMAASKQLPNQRNTITKESSSSYNGTTKRCSADEEMQRRADGHRSGSKIAVLFFDTPRGTNSQAGRAI